jgi:cytochrome c biogenesis protein ResB
LGSVVEHLAVLIVLAGVGLSLLLGWRETLVLEPGAAVDVGRATGIALRNDGFRIERYGDGSPAAYTAQVSIETLGETEARAIGVNQPATVRGARLFLQGYSPVGSRYVVTLLAVHDPGYGVVVVGGLLFLAGLVVALYFPRSSVHIRITGDGGLRLAGWADRRACDFDRDFAELAAELAGTGYWKPKANGSLPEGSGAPGTARPDLSE